MLKLVPRRKRGGGYVATPHALACHKMVARASRLQFRLRRTVNDSDYQLEARGFVHLNVRSFTADYLFCTEQRSFGGFRCSNRAL